MQIYSEEAVNTYTASTQTEPQVTTLADGSYVVVWQSYGQDTTNTYGIYAQRFSASGIPIGPEFAVSTMAEGNQSNPDIAALSNGGFVITWEGVDSNAAGVYAQRYNADGVPAGANILVNTITSSTQYETSVVGYDTGYAVVWASYGNNGNNTYDIYLQRYDTAGNPVGGETLVSTIPATSNPQTGQQHHPSVAAQSNGDLVIAWNDSSSNDGSGDGVYARLFSAGSGTFGDTFLVNTTTTGDQSHSNGEHGPSVAALAGGGSIVVWSANGQDGSGWGVYAQRLNADGSKNGGEFLVNQSTTGSQYHPHVTSLSTGGFVVTWYNDNYDLSGSGTTSDVYIREYDAGGVAVTAQVKITSVTDGQEYLPSVSDLGSGNYVVVYADYVSTAAGGNNSFEIQQRLFGDMAELPRQANPSLGDFSGTVTFGENIVNAAGQVIDPAVSLADIDSADFDGGRVDLFYTYQGEATDQLSVRNQGTSPGQIGLSGTSVTWGGTVIGTLSGGNNGTNLSILLNANSTVEAVEALIQNLTYASTSQSPAATRTVSIRVSDGDGGASASSSITINVTLELDGAPEVHVAERVNTYTASTQENPEIAVLGDGSYVIVWNSYGQDDTNSDGIYAQRFAANGVAMGPEFRINDAVDGAQHLPTIAALSDGGFVVTWQDQTSVDGSGYGVIAQRFDASGTAQGSNFVVNTTTSSTQYAGPVAGYTGGFAVMWSSANTGGSSWDIYVQRFDNAGSKVGGEQLVSTALGLSSAQTSQQYYGDIAARANGDMVVVWNDNGGNDGNSDGVFGRLYNATSGTFGGTFLVNTTTAGQQSNGSLGYEPKVAMAADGSFVVVWPANGQDGSGWGVFGQRFDASGAKLGGEFQINESTNGGQYQADITMLSTGGFVVTWHNDNYDISGTGSYQDTYIREYDAAGNAIDGERKITDNNSTGSNQQYLPAIADLGNGNFVVAYTGYNNIADGGNNSYEIYQNLFGSAVDLARSSANPVLTDVTSAVSYFENDVNATPQLLDPAVSLTDLDSADFGGGRLDLYYVQYGEATDQLGIRHQGNNAGQVGVSGSTVSFGGVAIGTLSGGTNGSNLSVLFNASATPDAVEAVIQNLTYASTATNPQPVRTVAVRVSDGDGGLSAPSTIAINVTLDLDGAQAVHGEERVNSYTPSTANTPQVADLAGGGYVVVWTSNGQDGSGDGVYGQRFDASGVAVGDEFRVNTGHTANQQDWPHVAGLSDGGFIITWQNNDGAVDGSGYSVQAQRYDASGTPAGANFTVNTHTTSNQYHDAVAAYTGGFAVVWASTSNPGGSNYDIYLQRYLNDGSLVGGETLVSTVGATAQTGAQYVPTIAAQTNGDLLIAWADSGANDGSLYGVYARLYDASAGTFGASFQVNTFTDGYQSYSDGQYGPEVSALADGGYIVVWASEQEGNSNYGVYGQRLDATGAAVGAEFQINESTVGNQYHPQVTGLSTGGFVVTWHNNSYDLSGSGTTQDVYLREYNASGIAIDGERKLLSPTNSVEQYPAIADLGNGNYVVVYSDYDTSAEGGNNSYEIKQQLFGNPVDLARSSAAPVLDDLQSIVYFTNNAADARYAGNAQVIDNDVSVMDADSTDFAGGRLVAQLLNGATATEALGVRNQGTSATQIGLSGSDVTYAGVIIGTLSGGGAGNSLLEVALNASASAEAVRALLENITYANTAPPANTTDRYVGFRLFDGDGGASEVPNVQIRIQNSYTPPTIALTDLEATRNITESQAQAGVLLDDAVQFDYNSATGFNGGSLNVSYISSTGRVDDQLSVRNQGTGTGQIGLSGSNVTYAGVTIGTVDGTSNGANGATLLITFNASATAEAVERLIENLNYRNLSDGPNPSRDIRVRVYDAANATSYQDIEVNIAAEADPAAPAPLFGEAQSNSFEAGSQQTPAVVRLSGPNDGGYVITWVSDGGQDGSANGVFAQRYAANGAAIGPEFQVNSHTLNSQYEPAIGGLADGGFVIAWRADSAQDGSGAGVYAQRYDASGAAVGGEFLVNTSTVSNQYEPAVLGLADGSFIVAYRSDYTDASSSYSYDVLAQRFNADGTPAGGEFALNTLVSGTQYQPQLAALDGGGFVAIWTDSSGDANGYGIVAQRFDNSGAPAGSAIAVNTTITGNQVGPDVAGLPGGGFVAVWHYNNNVYAQRFDASGVKVGAEIVVSTVDTAGNYSSYARVSSLDDGSFVVTWDSSYALGGSSYDVLAQKFDAAGNKIDGPMLVNTTTASWQYQPDITALGGDKFVIAWAGYNQEQAGTPSTYGVFHQLFGTAGSLTRSQAPELLDVTTAVTFDEAVVNVTPQIIDPGVNLIDTDSANFNGGHLWVSVISGYGDISYAQLPEDIRAQDQLGVRNQGTAAGQISLSGNSVSFGGTQIGTVLSNGSNGQDLVIQFNASATPTAVEALIENLTYGNTASAPVATRSISISVNDGAGGTSVPKVVQITVTPDFDGAQPLFDNERVNTYEPGTQDRPAITQLDDGGYVIVWTSAGQDGWGEGIYGQRFDANGVPVGSEFQINTYTPNDQETPAVTRLDGGGFMVSWQSYLQDGGGRGIYGQRFDANGVPVGSEFQINTTPANDQTESDVAALPGGGFVATWHSYYQDGVYQDVYAQRFDAAGAKIGAEFKVNTSTGFEGHFQGTPAISSFADGSFVIVWRGDGAQDGDVYGIFGQRFNADGTKAGGEFQVNTYATGYQYEPDVATLTDGGFVVVWRSDGQDGNAAGVFGQRYNADGTVSGSEFRVNTDTAGNEYEPSVSALSTGGFVVAWNDDGRAFVQQFDAAGLRVDNAMRADTLDNNNAANLPAVQGLANGSFVVAWRDYDYGSNNYNIYQQLFGAPGDFTHSANPQLVDVAPSVTFAENTVNAVPQLIDPGVGLFDADSPDFDGGILEVNYLTDYGAQDQLGLQGLDNQDQLGIRDQGAGTGQVGVSGLTVSYEGTAIGTILSNGQNGSKLTVLFNANATTEGVERVIENLTYANTVSNPIATRTISIRVSDGDGGASQARTVQINVTPEVDGAVPLGLEKVVNTTTASTQETPSVAVLADGGYVVVWNSYNQDAANTYGVYGQRYDADDNPVGSEFLVNTTTANNQYEPQVVGLNGGGFVVVWRADNQDGSGAGVYAQRYATDGTAQGSEFLVNTMTSNNQYQPAITASADGGFAVAWYHDAYSASNTEYADIFFRRFDANGVETQAETRANPPLGSTFVYQSQPAITWLANGGFVVVWTDNQTDGASNGVFGQVFDASGNAIAGADFQANSYITNQQDTPRVAALKGGGFVVVWASEGQDLSSTGIYAQRFDDAGNTVGAEFRVNTTISSTQYDPDIAALENGGWVITWSDTSSQSSSWDVWMQQYNAAGQAIDHETRVNSYTPHNQYQSSVAAMPDGGFVVAYTGYTYSGDGNGDGSPDGGSDSYDIRLQRFSNTAPEITDVSVNGVEEAVIVLDNTLFEAGFNDPDGQTLQAIKITTLPGNGTLKLSGTDVIPGQEISLADLQAGNLTYQGDLDFFGLDQFRWTGSDGIAFASTPVFTNINLSNVNDGPRFEAGADDTANEGTFFSHTLSIGDPDPESHHVTVNWGDGTANTVFSTSSPNPSISHYFADDGTYTVTVTVNDQQGQANSIEMDVFDVVVSNIAPTIGMSGDNSVVQGEVYTLDLHNPYDPGTDTVSEYRINWGDGTAEEVYLAANLPANGILTHTYADTGAKTISVTLVDEDGTWSNAGSKAITVAAPAEVITVNAGSDIGVNEGNFFQRTITFDDPTDQGAAGRSYTVDWGDGTNSGGNIGAGVSAFNIGHTYADGANNYTVTVTIDDDGQQGSDSFDVAVNNVAPSINLGGASSVPEGSPYVLTLNPANDPGDDTVSQYIIHWGDGTDETINAADLPANRQVSHTYADGNAARTITVDLVDEDGTWLVAGSRNITVTNVAPTIALSGADSVDEGSTYTLNLGAITDPGVDTVQTYQINWGDGTVETFTATEIQSDPSRDHVFADGGNGGTAYTIFVTLVDEDGTHTNAGNKAVTVNNVAPSATLGGVASMNEGDTFSLSIAGADPAGSADTLSYTIDWGDGSAVQTVTASELAGLGGSVDHLFADDEDGPINATARTISVTVSDEDGGSSTSTHAVTVNNVAPTIALSGAASVVLGSTYTLNLGAITDPGTDTVTAYTIDWGDGNTETVASDGDITHDYASTGNYTVSVGLTDEDGNHANAGSASVEVTAPSATLALEAGADATLAEGDTFTRTIAFSDGEDNGAAGWSYSIDYGDGSAAQTGTTLVKSLDLNHTYADGNAAHTVTVTLTDEAGETVSDSFAINVTNVAPTATVNGPAAVDEGSTYTLTVGTLSDPGTETITGYTIDWGDGNTDALSPTEWANAAGSFNHTYADGDASPTITVSVTDEDGTFVLGTQNVTVNNVAPDVEINGRDTVDEGETYELLLSISDEGQDDVLEVVIDWGDGTPGQTLTATELDALGGRVEHVFADDEDGPTNATARTISVTVSDQDGGSSTNTHTVTVNNVAPTIALSGAVSVVLGSTYTLNLGAITDPGTDTVTAYTIDWGDGNTETVASDGDITHDYASTGNYTVSVGLTDEDGNHANAGSASVEVTAPSATLALEAGADATLAEGDTFTRTIAFSDGEDNGAAGWSYSIDYGDGSAAQTGTTLVKSLNLNHTYADGNAAHTVTVTLTDEAGETVSDSFAITVNNVAPTADVSGTGLVSEGSTFTLTVGALNDPGADTVASYTIDWGDGSVDTFSPTEWGNAAGSFDHVYADGGASHTVIVSATDEDGTFVLGTEDVTVENLDPTLSISGVSDIDENSFFSLNISGSDPAGAADPLVFTIDWGDGSSLETITAAELAALGGSVEHFFTDDEDGVMDATAHEVVVTVRDGDGGETFETHTVTVHNVAPTLSQPLSGAASVNEGANYTLNFGSLVDPGVDVVLAYSLDWGDGSVETFTPAEFDALAGSIDHIYADGDATHTIILSVTDDDGDFTLGSTTVMVNNVAPTLSLSGADSINEGAVFSLSITSFDPAGDADPVIYSIDWGDGSADLIDATELAALGGIITHVYADDEDGTVNATDHTITVTLDDDDGGVTTATHIVAVNNVAPTLALSGAADGQAGSPYTLNLGTVVDPGDDTVSDYVIDWGDGSSTTVIDTGDHTHTYATDGNYTISVSIVDDDGIHANAGQLAINITPAEPAQVVRIGDAPTRVTSANPTAIEDAWMQGDHVSGVVHKADVTNTAEPWTAVDFGRGSPSTLAGADHFNGDLGVSGQSMATSPVRQEIDGKEGLRFELDQGANKVTVDLSRFYLNDDGSVFAESGRLKVFDAAGNVVGETTFVANAADGTRTITLSATEEFFAVELSTGAYDGTDFMFGGYAQSSGDFGSAPYTDGSGMHGSDFLVDWVEFEFPPIGVPPTDPNGTP